MTANPPPRPALRKADDASVHPAAPRLAAHGTAREDAPEGRPDRETGKRGNKGKPSGGHKKGKGKGTADIVVTLPKDVHKRLRLEASEHGLAPEEAILRLVRVWLDG